jgi:hypothetical protein
MLTVGLDEKAGLVFVGDLDSSLTAVATGKGAWQYNAGPDAQIWSTLGGLFLRGI